MATEQVVHRATDAVHVPPGESPGASNGAMTDWAAQIASMMTQIKQGPSPEEFMQMRLREEEVAKRKALKRKEQQQQQQQEEEEEDDDDDDNE